MRPLPWTFRVCLFAVGFGLGLSHYKPSTTQRPIVLEIHLAIPDSTPSGKIASPASLLPCGVPLPLHTAAPETTQTRL
jgi:hypothetical protein